MTSRLFRQLILAWWSLGIVCIAVTLITQRFLPTELVNYLDSVGKRDPTFIEWTAIGLGLGLFLVVVVASVGVFRFRRWGRSLFLWSHVLVLIPSVLVGESIMSGWAATFNYLYSILTGGILFTMFLPPIALFFEET